MHRGTRRSYERSIVSLGHYRTVGIFPRQLDVSKDIQESLHRWLAICEHMPRVDAPYFALKPLHRQTIRFSRPNIQHCGKCKRMTVGWHGEDGLQFIPLYSWGSPPLRWHIACGENGITEIYHHLLEKNIIRERQARPLTASEHRIECREEGASCWKSPQWTISMTTRARFVSILTRVNIVLTFRHFCHIP